MERHSAFMRERDNNVHEDITLPPTPILADYFISNGEDTARWPKEYKPPLRCATVEKNSFFISTNQHQYQYRWKTQRVQLSPLILKNAIHGPLLYGYSTMNKQRYTQTTVFIKWYTTTVFTCIGVCLALALTYLYVVTCGPRITSSCGRLILQTITSIGRKLLHIPLWFFRSKTQKYEKSAKDL
uniref:Uncharacterized protein n=1 Tax=Heterorhabditis bacteriophora TaxID=37862 RepID=A0A1I7W6U0_HETBA